MRTISIMSVYAPDSGKSLDEYEEFMVHVKKILKNGGQHETKQFFVAGDLNIQLGLLCTGDGEDDELLDMYGPPCWQNYDADPGGFKKLMWCELMRI